MAAEVRNYAAEARSTDVFGRVLCSAREQHFVIDGPSWNGCPHGALTSALVEGVARRCPLYGSVAASAGQLDVEVRTG